MSCFLTDKMLELMIEMLARTFGEATSTGKFRKYEIVP